MSGESFPRQILDWYTSHARRLPWRGECDPYRILVSEVMLQQTQVERIIPKYTEFLQRFPSLRDLAEASTSSVLKAWGGLGYNRRALNLKRTAETVRDEHKGELPASIVELEKLPGIGRYTARAIACFAFDTQVAVVDTNVRRVLSGHAGRELGLGEAEALSQTLMPTGQASEWNQALMDYGALVFRSKPKPRGASPQPFIETNRFWRGRILDVLRQRDSLLLPALAQALPANGRDPKRIEQLVRVLHEEGLVEYDPSGEVALPS